MDMFEMKTLAEGSRVVEKMADFAGNVIMQLLQKQNYVEEQGIKALLDHVRDGGGTRTVTVSEQRTEGRGFQGIAERCAYSFRGD